MRSTPRSGAIDAVRVLGIIAIVAGHVWGHQTTHNLLYAWHVPVFFFLTGYFWTPGRAVVQEARKRWATLARPYIFWLVVLLATSIAINLYRQDLSQGDVVGPLYGGAIATQPFSAFWFVTVLFFAAVGYRLLDRVSPELRWSAAACGLVVGYFAGTLLAKTPLSIGSALPCLAFIATGEVFRRVEPKLRAPVLVGVALLGGSTMLVLTGWSAPLDIKQGNYGTPIISVFVASAISAGLVLTAKAASAHVPARAHKTATGLAQAGFVVILTHAVVLMVLSTTPKDEVYRFLLALCVPWLLGLILVRSQLSAWAAGIGQANRPAVQGKHHTEQAELRD
jgi:acyltransferase